MRRLSLSPSLASLIVVTAMAVMAGAACDDSGPSSPPPPDPPSVAVEYLTPTDHLVRASMVLRGIRPSPDELKQVATDGAALPGIVDRYLAAPEFGATIKDLHNETLWLRTNQTQFTHRPIPGTAFATGTFQETAESLSDEPLRLIEHVVMADRPYSEIVTADYTYANGIVAAIWGLPYTGNGTEWKQTSWQSAVEPRPAAGILSSSELYFRFRSAGANYHRGRANTISRALLCHDYLASDIIVDTSIDLSDPAVVANAVVANPSCAGCHQTLDPLGSFLPAFDNNPLVGRVTTYPVTNFYRPSRELQWKQTTRRPPGYFGVAEQGLGGLGKQIAADPRFARCAAQRFASYFTEREMSELPVSWISKLTDSFVSSNLNAKALARAIVLSDEFRVSHVTPGQAEGDAAAERIVGLQKVRPEQLDRMIADLTGYRWQHDSTTKAGGVTIGVASLLQSDLVGFRVLAGGIDSYFVTLPSHTFNAVSSLVMRRLAADAASFVVTADLAKPSRAARKLLTMVDASTRAPAAIHAQLAALHLRIYGALDEASSAEVELTYGLFADTLAASNDTTYAWKTTIAAMLQDSRVAYF
jgi:Protein of unknown function (DUF1585)/Protein of unknown function (DUF1588)/Protein of unknown function (DUF1592)